jgi:cytochrome c peroxidase
MKMTLFINALAVFLFFGAQITHAFPLTQEEQLGKIMFQDKDFSFNSTQSCQTCHHRTAGFADPTNARDPYYTVVSLGADGVSKGGRNAPSAAYVGYNPPLYQDADSGEWYGGLFWDGRATGAGITTGDPLAEQAQGPPLNPVEMNMPSKEAVVQAVRDADYHRLFIKVYGRGSLDNIDTAFDLIATAIAAYERSVEVQQFSSRFDQNALTDQESRGKEVFAANCAKCHSMDETPAGAALFTNFGYANIGIPKNPLIPSAGPDIGLGKTLEDLGYYADDQYGKFKIPSLRNIGTSAPYGHNGYFPTLKDIVNFKNNRCLDSASCPSPEVTVNITEEVGNMGLSPAQVDDLAVFLMTLTDR